MPLFSGNERDTKAQTSDLPAQGLSGRISETRPAAVEVFLNRSWAEVDLRCIRDNILSLRQNMRRQTEICAVVKADAYGHGVAEVVPVLLANGATRLAVSMLDEAIELRRTGVTVPILVLGYTDPRRAEEVIRQGITQTVYSRDLAMALSEAGLRIGMDARIHIKVDTGMGRVGFMAGYEAVKAIEEIRRLPRIIIEGLFTHFSSADEPDDRFTRLQFERFMSISAELDRIGIRIPIKHVCNSAATLLFPEMHLDMVRPGLILYGMMPPGCPAPALAVELKTAMTLKSNVVLVKEVPAGTPISYGRTFVTSRPSKIATLPIGYADGYARRLSNKAMILIGGQEYPIVGRICMDHCMADVTDSVNPVRTGDEVVLFGRQQAGDRSANLPVDTMAEWMETINYEVTCIIGRRMPRAYRDDEGICSVHNYLI